MYKFDKYDFGKKLKTFRKSQGLTQNEFADKLGIERSNISRYENGDTLPSIEIFLEMCNILNIDIENFVKYINVEKENNIENPFNCDTVYVYYISSSNRSRKAKFRFDIIQKKDKLEVQWVGCTNNTIYMTGELIANDDVAFFLFQNYEPNNPQLERTEIIINLRYSADGIYMGTLNGNADGYKQVTKKIMLSKNDLEFTEEMLERLKISNKEYENMKKDWCWYVDTRNKTDFFNE